MQKTTDDFVLPHEKVKKTQAGDITAFGELVKMFQDAVYGVAYAMVGNFHDAQDIAQEAFIQAWRSLDSLKEPAKFPNWLCSQSSVVYFVNHSYRKESVHRLSAASQTRHGRVGRGLYGT